VIGRGHFRTIYVQPDATGQIPRSHHVSPARAADVVVGESPACTVGIVFDEQLQNTGISINAMHPGAVKTETGQDNGPLYRWYKRNFLDKTLRSPEISAEALYYLGVSEEIEAVSGKFFNLTTVEEPAPPALDKEVAYELWEKSLDLGGLRDSTAPVPDPVRMSRIAAQEGGRDVRPLTGTWPRLLPPWSRRPVLTGPNWSILPSGSSRTPRRYGEPQAE